MEIIIWTSSLGRCWILCKKSKITHFFYPFCKLQNLIHIIHKGSIIRNDWAHQKENHENGSLFSCRRVPAYLRYPIPKSLPSGKGLFSAMPKNRADEGNHWFLTPCHFVTSPIRGILSSTSFQPGVPAAAMFSEHLADADDAALMRLRYAQNNFPFILVGFVKVYTFEPAYTEALLHTFIRCLSPK